MLGEDLYNLHCSFDFNRHRCFWGIYLRDGGRASAAPPETQAFSGTYTPTTCGTRHAFVVPAGKTSIVVVASATVAANDIILNLYSEGATASSNDDLLISSNDTATSPETATYQPAGGVPPDTYKAEVCPFSEGSQVSPSPIQYNGTFTTDDAPIGGTPTPTPATTPTPHPPSNPTRSSGNITFGPATVADLQRTEAEPLNFIDRNGNTLTTGPYGASTASSILQRSTDGGDTYHVVAFNGLRPNPGTGGGDSDVIVDDQGFMYFIDLEALANLGCAVSNDNGNNWKTNSACVQDAGVDRQWFAVDNGANLASAADNTIFAAYRNAALGSSIYSSPGSTGTADAVGGVVYQNAATAININDGAPCGQMRFDTVKRNLYYPCGNGTNVKLTIGRVNPGQRTGIQFRTVTTPTSPGGGDVRGVFPVVATDAGGNVYVAWLDANDRNVYYTYSDNEGASWSPPVRVNSAPSGSAVFPWIQGGAAGNLVVMWYGLDTVGVPSDNLPSWTTNPAAADDSKWFGYAALVTNAASSTPNIEQNRFTRHPMHYGQICTGGLGCAAGGDRTMAEYGAVYLDSAGAMRFVFNDTTSQYHGAHLFAVRQRTGPTAKGTTLNRAEPGSPMPDPAGDAQTPHYSPAGTGANMPQLDFTAFRISQPNSATLRFHFRLNSLASLLPPAGKTNAFWMARFQALSNADTAGAEAHRIFYVGAESVGGTDPTFFLGSPTLAGAPMGCTQTTPGTCKITQYPAEITTAVGQRDGDTLCVDMPLTAFGASRPINGTKLFSVTAFSGGRNGSVSDIHLESDATPAFDYTLGSAGSSTCSIAPTAAAAFVTGRVTDAIGKPLYNVSVTLSGANGSINETVRTNRLGFYKFEGIPTGGSYLISPVRRGYVFNPTNRFQDLLEDLENVNFVGSLRKTFGRDKQKYKSKKVSPRAPNRGQVARLAHRRQ